MDKKKVSKIAPVGGNEPFRAQEVSDDTQILTVECLYNSRVCERSITVVASIVRQSYGALL